MMRAAQIVFTLLAALSLAPAVVQAQIVPADGHNRPQTMPDSVAYLFPEQVTVPAGKSSPILLHFRVAPGLHINSHTPSDNYLIPTTFSIPPGANARLDEADYPAGAEITLPIDPATKLSVYTGDFIIAARIIAAPGNHLIEGKLHYQACDRNECLPPKTITVPIDVIGR
jgi:Disulphide bond corrector protein DsbC